MIIYMHVHVGATGEEVRSMARSCSSITSLSENCS